jgi:plastocyanin
MAHKEASQMNKKGIFIGLMMLGLFVLIGTSRTSAETFDVNMGDASPDCSAFGATDVGFVDCTSKTGGIGTTAVTTISAGDTVRWTMRSTPHTATSEAGLTGGPSAACATGDKWDSGITNAFSAGLVFTHAFKTPGSCAYYCLTHPMMQGRVDVAPRKGQQKSQQDKPKQ